MFAKIDKKIIIILIIALAAILLLGFSAYKYFSGVEVENSAGGTNIEEVEIEAQPVEPEESAQEKKGTITVCSDECGNGTCQESDPYCTDNLNCICPETPQECPQDCK